MQICECGNSDPLEFEFIYSGEGELYHIEYTPQLLFTGNLKFEKNVKAICCKKCGLVINSRIVENIVLQRKDLIRFFYRCGDSRKTVERLDAFLNKIPSNFKRFHGMSLGDARKIILEEFDGRDENVGRKKRNRDR